MRLTVRRVTTGTVDKVTDIGGPGFLTYVIDAAILPAPRNPNLDFVADALRRHDVRKLLVAGKSAERDPELNDTVFFEGTQWKVRGIDRLAPDGQGVILWTLFVERGG